MLRKFADSMGFSIVNKTRIATAVSELAQNVYNYGGGAYVDEKDKYWLKNRY